MGRGEGATFQQRILLRQKLQTLHQEIFPKGSTGHPQAPAQSHSQVSDQHVLTKGLEETRPQTLCPVKTEKQGLTVKLNDGSETSCWRHQALRSPACCPLRVRGTTPPAGHLVLHRRSHECCTGPTPPHASDPESVQTSTPSFLAAGHQESFTTL